MEQEEISEKIAEIIEEGESELSDWERNFLSDITKKLEDREILSPYTGKKVQEIYDKIFS